MANPNPETGKRSSSSSSPLKTLKPCPWVCHVKRVESLGVLMMICRRRRRRRRRPRRAGAAAYLPITPPPFPSLISVWVELDPHSETWANNEAWNQRVTFVQMASSEGFQNGLWMMLRICNSMARDIDRHLPMRSEQVHLTSFCARL